MYKSLGISLMLAALLTVNAAASVMASLGWRLLARPLGCCSAKTRARILFALRTTPPALALIFVAGFLVPAYIVYEPDNTPEVVSGKLAALALVSAIGVALTVWRGLRSWLATQKLLKQWLARAEPIRIGQVSIPAFRIEHPFPVMAVVGSIRPRLFVASRVLESLSDDELRATLAHESGHLVEHDNLKRILIRACRDVLAIVPCGRSLDRAWAENAEAAADESAANHGSAVALNLASALIEIARMVPPGSRPTMPVGAMLLGDETDGVKVRVKRLLDLADTGVRQSRCSSNISGWYGRTLFLSAIFLLLFFLINASTLAALHDAIEHAVRFLS